ncbi:MAG: hypothetical protein R3F55_18325 [Alphaproteobacteria bacterium]
MSKITDQERETLQHIVNGDMAPDFPAEHIERLQILGLIEPAADGWKATPAGRMAGVPRPEHL